MDLVISSPLTLISPPPHLVNYTQHVLVTSSMFLFLLASAKYFCRSSVGFAIIAAVLVYYTAMIHLDLFRQCRRRRGNLDRVMWPVMVLAAGITTISLSTAVLLFQPNRHDLGYILVFSFLCKELILGIHSLAILLDYCKGQEEEDEKYRDASDLV